MAPNRLKANYYKKRCEETFAQIRRLSLQPRTEDTEALYNALRRKLVGFQERLDMYSGKK